MRRVGFVIMVACMLCPQRATAETPTLQVFPGRRVFAPLVADPHEPKLAAEYVGATKGRLIGYEFHIGVAAPLVQLTWPAPANSTDAVERALQIGGDAGAQFFIDEGAHFPLQVSDFHVGLPVDYRAGKFTARVRLAHTSSHIGDDFLSRHPSFLPQRFNREFVTLLPSYTLGPARVYGGGSYLLHSDPQLPREMVQWGVQIEGPQLWEDHLGTFMAADFQAKAENDYSIKSNVIAGIALQAPPDHRLCLAFRFFDGYSPLGQFYRERQQWFGVGLFYSPTLGLPGAAP